MKLLKSFGRFWYDFLIGDDWKIAFCVVVALGVTLGLMRADIFSDQVLTVLGAILVATAFTISLVVDVRDTGRIAPAEPDGRQ